MITKQNGLIYLLGLLLLSTGSAYAEDWHVAVSGKAWHNSWEEWSLVNNAGTRYIESSKTALVGGISAKNGNFFLSANYSPDTSYDKSQYGLGTGQRKEYDLNIGYYVIPQMAVSLGKKHMEYTSASHPAERWKYDFVTLGLSLNAPIVDTQAFMYANGSLSLTGTITPPPFTVALGNTFDNPSYQSIEAGLGYRVSNKLIATIGYKYQLVKGKFTAIYSETRDSTSGLLVGLSYNLF